MRRSWLALAILLAAIACRSDVPWGREGPPERRAPLATLEGVVFDGYRAGSRNVRLRAGGARVDWESGRVGLERVRILLPGQTRGPVEVAAAAGSIDLKTRAFSLDGEVVASTADGGRFETRALHYDPERGLLVGDEPVRLVRSRLEVVGTGIELDLGGRTVRLRGPVTARTRPG